MYFNYRGVATIFVSTPAVDHVLYKTWSFAYILMHEYDILTISLFFYEIIR